MHPPRLTRWSSVLLLTTSLAGLSAPPAHAADPTLWEQVKYGTQQIMLAGGDAAHDLAAWISGLQGGSRLAAELDALAGKDLRSLELLTESAGYRLADIIIHRDIRTGAGAGVTLSFAFQHSADPRRTAELREIIARDNALVDEDTRIVLGALLDATVQTPAAPRERFETQRIEVRLGQPPLVTLDFQSRNALPAQARRDSNQSHLASLNLALIPAVAATGAERESAQIQLVSSEPAATDPNLIDPRPAAIPPSPVAQAPEPTPPATPLLVPAVAPVVAEPEQLPAAEAARATDSVTEAKPPADITGVNELPQAANPVKPAEAPSPEPLKVEVPAPAPVAPPEPLKVEVPAPAPVAQPEPLKVEAPAPAPVAPPEPLKVEVPAPAPVAQPEPLKVEVPALAPVAQPEPVRVEAPAPAPAAEVQPLTTYRVTLKRTNGRAHPLRNAAKVRVLSPKDVLVKTGNAKGRWVEFTVNGETGPKSKVWIYDGVFREKK